ncbi:MAG: hypothetical protein ACPHIT_05585 [Flavobacteriaceae bacterium]
MGAYLKILILLLILTEPVWSQNELIFFQTNWGFSGSWEAFFSKTKASGYDGVEIWFPKEKEQLQEVTQGLKKHELKVIYLCGTNRDLPFEESLSAYQNDLIRAIDQNLMLLILIQEVIFSALNKIRSLSYWQMN